jgi:thiol-disulfide isomerase/thioredoxin
MKTIVSACMGIAFGLAALSQGADESNHKISEWKLGKVLSGAKVTKDDLIGKVVVIDYWGAICPRCLALVPDLVKLDELHREEGLLIIGAESQGHPEEKIRAVVKKQKMGYTITAGASGPIELTGIPHAFVFDMKGKLVFSGNPSEGKFERTIKKALEDGVKKETGDIAVTANLFETRMWTNADGKQLKAAVKDATEENVTFLMFDGKVVTYPMEKLSEESRQQITEAMTTKQKIKER